MGTITSFTYTNVGTAGAYDKVVDGWSKATGCVQDTNGLTFRSCRLASRHLDYLSFVDCAAWAISSGSIGNSDKSGSRMISMRRFSRRPSGVVFLAIGSNSP